MLWKQARGSKCIRYLQIGNEMKKITNKLREELKNNFSFVAALENVDVTRTDSSYWAGILKGAEWNLFEEQKRYIDLIMSHIIQVHVSHNDAILGAIALVKVERQLESNTLFSREYDDIHTEQADYEYLINKENYEDNLNKLLSNPNRYSPLINMRKEEIVSGKKIYDVTTKGQEAAPDCKKCHGHGFVPCDECGGRWEKKRKSAKLAEATVLFHKGSGKTTCNKCYGSGILHCNKCNDGQIICSSCGGFGYLVCSHCKGVGVIEYNAGNYADGSVKIKSKECPFCNGSGKLECPVCKGEGGHTCSACGGVPESTCPDCNGSGEIDCQKCHGAGELECPKCHGLGKTHKTDCVQLVKCFEDKYTVERIIDVNLIPSKEEDSVFVIDSEGNCSHFISDWFKPFNLSLLYNQKEEIIEDNTQKIINDVCGPSEISKKVFEEIRNNALHKINISESEKKVCSTENYYKLDDVITITIEHSIDEYGSSELVLFLYDGNIWCNEWFPEISIAEKIKILAKTKLKGLFGRK